MYTTVLTDASDLTATTAPNPARRVATGIAILTVAFAALLAGCGAPPSAPAAPAPTAVAPPTEAATAAVASAAAETANQVATEVATATGASQPAAAPAEVVVYVSGLPGSALYELEVWEDSASPGGTLLGVTNYGADLDAPPENDPHAAFTVLVSSGVPYRCWVHMKVGSPRGVSEANRLYVQFSNAVDASGTEILVPESESYLTAQGPTEEGWAWVPCNLDGAAALVYFAVDGETTVRVQAGMEGVGFDQFVLSPAEYLEAAPAEPVVAQP